MIRQYTGTDEEDLAIGVWWLKMKADGDLEDMLAPSARSLHGLMRMFQPPNVMLYHSDEAHGIWAAAWYEQLMNGVFMGAWIAREERHTKRGLRAILSFHEVALQASSTLFVVTKQERIVDELQRLGYALLTKAPRLWSASEDAWILMLTRPAHEATKGRLRRLYEKKEVMAHGR